MTAAEVVGMFIKWQQMEERRTPNGEPRTGLFTVMPLPPEHGAGMYQIIATNTLCPASAERDFKESEFAVFIEGLKNIDAILRGMSGFADCERVQDRKESWECLFTSKGGG